MNIIGNNISLVAITSATHTHGNTISHIQYNYNKWQQNLPQSMAITSAIEQKELKWATTSAPVA